MLTEQNERFSVAESEADSTGEVQMGVTETPTRLRALRKQHRYMNRQLCLLQDQYATWNVRHRRAVVNGQHHFIYVLHLRLVTLEGIIKRVYDCAEAKLAEILALTALSSVFPEDVRW